MFVRDVRTPSTIVKKLSFHGEAIYGRKLGGRENQMNTGREIVSRNNKGGKRDHGARMEGGKGRYYGINLFTVEKSVLATSNFGRCSRYQRLVFSAMFSCSGRHTFGCGECKCGPDTAQTELTRRSLAVGLERLLAGICTGIGTEKFPQRSEELETRKQGYDRCNKTVSGRRRVSSTASLVEEPPSQ